MRAPPAVLCIRFLLYVAITGNRSLPFARGHSSLSPKTATLGAAAPQGKRRALLPLMLHLLTVAPPSGVSARRQTRGCLSQDGHRSWGARLSARSLGVSCLLLCALGVFRSSLHEASGPDIDSPRTNNRSLQRRLHFPGLFCWMCSRFVATKPEAASGRIVGQYDVHSGYREELPTWNGK